MNDLHFNLKEPLTVESLIRLDKVDLVYNQVTFKSKMIEHRITMILLIGISLALLILLSVDAPGISKLWLFVATSMSVYLLVYNVDAFVKGVINGAESSGMFLPSIDFVDYDKLRGENESVNHYLCMVHFQKRRLSQYEFNELKEVIRNGRSI